MVTRRGAAMLLVLVIVAVGTSAIVAAAVVSSTARMKHDLISAAESLDDLLRACDEPIMWFLNNVADEVALPPDAPTPEVAVLHDRIQGDRSIEVRITAWDQSGMAPWTVARTASPLRSAVHAEILWTLDSLSSIETPPGLDLIAPQHAMRVFPVPSDDGDGADSAFSELPAFGAFIATHQSRAASRGRINVNTAPEPLLAAAMRAAGLGGLDAIMQNRERGEANRMGEATVGGAGGAGGAGAAVDMAARGRPTAPRLVSRSDAWAFRIDLHHGRVGRSWWVVYQRMTVEQPAGAAFEWRCVQRLLIPDGPRPRSGPAEGERDGREGEGSDPI